MIERHERRRERRREIGSLSRDLALCAVFVLVAGGLTVACTMFHAHIRLGLPTLPPLAFAGLAASLAVILVPGFWWSRSAWRRLGLFDDELGSAMTYRLWWNVFLGAQILVVPLGFVAWASSWGEDLRMSYARKHFGEARAALLKTRLPVISASVETELKSFSSVDSVKGLVSRRGNGTFTVTGVRNPLGAKGIPAPPFHFGVVAPAEERQWGSSVSEKENPKRWFVRPFLLTGRVQPKFEVSDLVVIRGHLTMPVEFPAPVGVGYFTNKIESVSTKDIDVLVAPNPEDYVVAKTILVTPVGQGGEGGFDLFSICLFGGFLTAYWTILFSHALAWMVKMLVTRQDRVGLRIG